jgi:hypothetical protein
MINFWVTCKKFTCLVQVKNHKIIGGAPIIRRWIGQNFHKLLVYYKVDSFCVLYGKENE